MEIKVEDIENLIKKCNELIASNLKFQKEVTEPLIEKFKKAKLL